jgi:SAM-dependent methyltransferase
VDVARHGAQRAVLAEFQRKSPEDFAALFEEGRAVLEVPAEVAALPMIDAVPDGFTSRCLLFSWDGDFFACDWRGANADEVFRPHRDEVSVCAADYLPTRERSVVLDLGTGCGIYGIRARLRTCAVVTARDINRRAVAFARRNAEWNGATGITYEVADLFDGLGPSFDLVILGLPYQPTPPAAHIKIYSFGGNDGSLLLRAALSRLDAVLVDGGTAVACCGSLGTPSGAAIVEDLPRVLPQGRWRVTVSGLREPVTLDDWWQTKLARPATKVEQGWLAGLKASGRGWFHYCIIRVSLRARYGRDGVEVEDLGVRDGMATKRLLSRVPRLPRVEERKCGAEAACRESPVGARLRQPHP